MPYIYTITFLTLVSLCSSCIFPGYSEAQPLRAGPPPKTDWTITVGVAPVYSPLFQGAKDYAFSIFPDLRVTYKDDFFASVPEGIGYNFYNHSGLKFGPIAKIRFSRDEATGGSPFLIAGESEALKGLGDVGTAGELGGFLQYTYERIRSSIEVRRGFGGHEGTLLDTGIRYVQRYGPLNASVGPRVTFAHRNFTNSYFGVDYEQSQASRLPAYNAESGIISYGLGGSLNMPISASTAITLFCSYDRLGEPTGNSPLVTERGSRNQATVGLAIGYRFGWNINGVNM
jgi:outer membrane protein